MQTLLRIATTPREEDDIEVGDTNMVNIWKSIFTVEKCLLEDHKTKKRT